MSVGGQRHATAALPPVPTVQGAGSAPGSVWTDATNFTASLFDLLTVMLVASRSTD